MFLLASMLYQLGISMRVLHLVISLILPNMFYLILQSHTYLFGSRYVIR